MGIASPWALTLAFTLPAQIRRSTLDEELYVSLTKWHWAGALGLGEQPGRNRCKNVASLRSSEPFSGILTVAADGYLPMYCGPIVYARHS